MFLGSVSFEESFTPLHIVLYMVSESVSDLRPAKGSARLSGIVQLFLGV